MSSIDRIENRIRQIEQRIERGPSVDSQAFGRILSSQSSQPEATFGASGNALNKLDQIGLLNRIDLQTVRAAPTSPVVPQAQSNDVSCGQTSVAMCLNSLTGGSLTDMDIDADYGFHLLTALKTESRSAGYDWSDAGNISADSWATIDKKVNQEKLPVIVALNGPEFSPSGRGHIVTIVKTEGEVVTYADPADGTMKTTTKQNMQTAPSHPDGNFLFVADRLDNRPLSNPEHGVASL